MFWYIRNVRRVLQFEWFVRLRFAIQDLKFLMRIYSILRDANRRFKNVAALYWISGLYGEYLKMNYHKPSIQCNCMYYVYSTIWWVVSYELWAMNRKRKLISKTKFAFWWSIWNKLNGFDSAFRNEIKKNHSGIYFHEKSIEL